MKRSENSLFSAIERAVELIMALSSFMLAYAVAAKTLTSVPVILDTPKTLILLFISVILYSLVAEFCRTNAPQAIGALRILLSSLVYFGISVGFTIIFAKEERIIFLLRWTLFAGAISCAFMIAKSLLLYFLLQRIKASVRRRLLLLGEASEDFIKDASGEYEVIHSLEFQERSLLGVEELLNKYSPDLAVFSLSDVQKGEAIHLVNLCDDKCVRCYFLPTFYGYLKSGRQVEYLGANVLINVHSTPLDQGINRLLKRAIDIFGAAFLIILTLPLMLIAAIGVKLSSRGPIFFKQKRIGIGGKPFTMLKFRSMRMGGEENTVWSTGVDSRKTRFGNLLRKTSIDELPQLFNVLFGTMSLVGPRPEIEHFVDKFRREIPLYMVKHYVKPGITGLAQIKGLRGDTSIVKRIEADIFYIENWSLSLDIKILLVTPLKAINKREKYISPEEKGEK